MVSASRRPWSIARLRRRDSGIVTQVTTVSAEKESASGSGRTSEASASAARASASYFSLCMRIRWIPSWGRRPQAVTPGAGSA